MNIEAIGAAKSRMRDFKRSLGIPKPIKAIRDKCLECVCGSEPEIRRCRMGDCPLWPYRIGRSPRPADLKVPVSDTYGNITGETDFKGYMLK